MHGNRSVIQLQYIHYVITLVLNKAYAASPLAQIQVITLTGDSHAAMPIL